MDRLPTVSGSLCTPHPGTEVRQVDHMEYLAHLKPRLFRPSPSLAHLGVLPKDV